MYTYEQRMTAVKLYIKYFHRASTVIRELGYPNRHVLVNWYKEYEATGDLHRTSQQGKHQKFTEDQKRIALEFYQEHGRSFTLTVRALGYPGMTTLKEWVNEELKRNVYRLQLERDILEKAGEILKKGQGINLKTLTNHEKAELVGALRGKYRLNELLVALKISKSSYCYQAKRMREPDKYSKLRTDLSNLFTAVGGCYGYRRLHALLKKSGVIVSEKVVRRLMSEEGLVVRRIKHRKYSSYIGEISPEVANIINRDFHAEQPNEKWLTDITEFSIPAGKVYLSPIIDCFDGLAVTWTIGVSPSSELVNSMLDAAIAELSDSERPIIHSDRGGHYRWPGWIERMDSAGLIRSMSKKGCSPDNSACEGFFGRLKNEMFYNRSWRGVTIEEFIKKLDAYLHWYNEDRIKESLNWMSPLEYRRSLSLCK